MPVWYTPAPQELLGRIAEVIDAYHPDLVEAEARIGAIVAHPDPKSDKPAMMKNGLQILAKIKANSEADRVDGKPDATITFDAEHLDDLARDDLDGLAKLRALIDHELYHLQVRRKRKTKEIITDDARRPKLKIRPHDWELTGFRVVADRHKLHAAEVIEYRHFHDKRGNLLMTFAEEHAVQRTIDFATEVLGMTEAAVEEVNRDHEKQGMPRPFVGRRESPGDQIVREAVDRINAGEDGPNITAELIGPGARHPADGVVAAANR